MYRLYVATQVFIILFVIFSIDKLFCHKDTRTYINVALLIMSNNLVLIRLPDRSIIKQSINHNTLTSLA